MCHQPHAWGITPYSPSRTVEAGCSQQRLDTTRTRWFFLQVTPGWGNEHITPDIITTPYSNLTAQPATRVSRELASQRENNEASVNVLRPVLPLAPTLACPSAFFYAPPPPSRVFSFSFSYVFQLKQADCWVL